MKENIDNLIEDYKNRLIAIKKTLKEGGDDLKINRLSTMSSCYRSFITELERLKEE